VSAEAIDDRAGRGKCAEWECCGANSAVNVTEAPKANERTLSRVRLARPIKSYCDVPKISMQIVSERLSRFELSDPVKND
jgi:hypothetical protein